ncbi:hypothetical protein S-PM2d233 [Synechococcus phage S-PM2]|uniref:Hypothetical-Protein / belonging to T4-LIKE GC: 744 n=1 Tax=Synechococcus phage S-PM2 TaxID=238854 RepID=Q5GQA4_BPSYP|nr:Hypothetical-Protein / belonging to T4-LIKE GC: 744 [Synechococcus phage S-PM2]CAF34298.1 Hypothetical-Protein / belonging to T4-LIKE GC: 744 [Synechococcus phage S-PM2]CFW42480.1 hypothetical protein S-PM2d233 [Synechococcus phage S-PM2]
MTIENAPLIPNTKEFNDKIYRQARKDRLSDTITDYMNDEDSGILNFYHDLTDEIQFWIDHHTKQLEKANGILRLVHGSSPSDVESQIKAGQFLVE